MNSYNPVPHFCSDCQKIEIDGTGPSINLRFTYTRRRVEELAKRCALFQWALKLLNPPLQASDKLTLSIYQDGEDLECLNANWEGVYDESEKSRLYIFTREDDFAAKYIKSRPLAQPRVELEDLQHYRKRLEDCLSHKLCREATRRFQSDMAPTRLLCISQDSKLRLHTVSKGDKPRYAALSYCWGQTEQQKKTKTTRANVRDRHNDIELSQLPRTIRDAVKVTQSLGLSYLWVDALCIIQDDQEDSAHEIANMASIYRGSVITIAAASAKDSTEGFLRGRDLARAYGSLFKLPYCHRRDDKVVKGSILLSEQPICDTFEEPLDERAWAMQEGILPLRLLRFGSRQTIWRCLELLDNLDGGSCPSVKYYGGEDPNFSIDNPYRVTEVQLHMADSSPSGPNIVWENWSDAIMKYTSRTISRTSDKLPGCAALAEIFAEILGLSASDYLAGLWENDIYSQLLWFRPEGSVSKRCAGPTWSWVSLNGPVEFFSRRLLEDGDSVSSDAILENSNVVRKYKNNEYSEVESGCLWLKGLLRQAYWDAAYLRRSINSPDALPLKIFWDSSSSVPPQIVWCFEIIASYRSLGLVLRMNEQMEFERVGFFEDDLSEALVVKNWFNEAERRSITLF